MSFALVLRRFVTGALLTTLLACGGTVAPVAHSTGPQPEGGPAEGGGSVADQPDAGEPETGQPGGVGIANPSFSLPVDGVPNANGYIGPFCCTGVTVTVDGTDGSALGYVYFFGFTNGVNAPDDMSYAQDLSILISGVPSIDDPSAPQVTGEIDFAASAMQAGVSKSGQTGALLYRVTLTHVDIEPVDGQPYYDMGTLTVSVDVSIAP